VNQEKGFRPKRTVVGASFGADIANEKIKPIQANLMSTLKLSSLEQVKT